AQRLGRRRGPPVRLAAFMTSRAAVTIGMLFLALSVSCNSPQKEVERGEQLAMQHNMKEAAAAFDRAIRSDSSLVRAWIGRGQVALLTNAGDAAARAFHQAATLDPKNEVAWLGLARADRRLQLHREAIDAYNHAIAIAPDDGMPYYELATLNAENNASE